MKQSKIGIVGAGNMGSAFYEGLKKIFSQESLFIADSNDQKLKKLKTKNIFGKYEQILPKVQVVILAIKPQSFYDLEEKQLKLLSQKMVISIMAGVSLKSLAQRTGAQK